MEPLYDDLRQAAVDYAAALNAYAATIAAQVSRRYCILASACIAVDCKRCASPLPSETKHRLATSLQQCLRMWARSCLDPRLPDAKALRHVALFTAV